MTLPLRVIKLGGSLLGYPKLKNKLADWLLAQLPAQNLVVVGGGPLANGIRHWQEWQGAPDVEAHWAAIGAMSVTARMFCEFFPCWPIIGRYDSSAPQSGQTWILDVTDFMRDDVRQSRALEQDWTVTSDSIAARVADRYRADELVLLKSTDRAAAGQLAVDQSFVAVCPTGMPVRWVNLRSS